MFLNLVIKQISETVAGGIKSASIAKRIAFIQQEENLQRRLAISDTKSMMPLPNDMTRRDLRKIISMAHDALHTGDTEKAHDILHDAYSTEPEHDCMSADQEVVQAVKRFDDMTEGKLPCGHIIGDLIWAPGSITKCGACVSNRSTTLD